MTPAGEIVLLQGLPVRFRGAGQPPPCTPEWAQTLRRNWNGRRKYWPSEALDARIRQAYDARYRGNDRRAILRLAVACDWPKWRVVRRAAELGLSRIKEPPWNEAELALLEEWKFLTAEAIARKFRQAELARTATAIKLKLKRLDLDRRAGVYSATALAAALGVDGHKIVAWIRARLLAAEPRGSARRPEQGGDSWLIREADVRAFIFAHAEEIDLAKVSKWWFLSLLTEGRISR